MGRKKQRGDVKRLPIELDMAKAADRAIWNYWDSLAESGRAAQWARDTLYNALPTVKPASPKVVKTTRPAPTLEDIIEDNPNEPHYEPIQE